MEENKVAIADGLAVRSQFEQAYVDAYVAAVGDACTDDMKTQQAEVAKSFSIDILKQKTEGFRDAAKINYPAGKVIKPTDSGDAGADPEAYPIGV